MRSSKPYGSSIILCLGLAACAGTEPGSSTDGGYRPPRTEAGTLADFVVPQPGTNCKAEHTSAIYTSTEDRPPWWPRINWSNDRYGVLLMQPYHIKADSQERYKVGMITLDRAGQIMNGPTWITPEPTGYSLGPGAIVGLSKGFGLAWSDMREDPKTFKRDIYYQRVDESGAPQGGAVKLSASGKASFPSMDAPGFVAIEGPRQVSELAVVWSDSRELRDDPYGGGTSGRRDIYFKKIDIDGKQLVAEKAITTKDSKPYASWPALAYDGTGYAMAWENSPPSGGSNDRFLVLLDLDGGLKSTEKDLGKDYGLMSSAPDLVATDNEYGITYSENRSKDNGRIRFSRIDKRGEMMAAQQATALENPCTPAIAFNGERYAVVWQSNCGKDGSALKFALLDDGGHPLAADGSSCFGSTDPNCGVITISPPSQGVAAFPDIIGVAGRFAVTWMNAPEKKIFFSHITCTPN